MAASLINTANLAVDPAFRSRVQAAMVTAGLQIAAEAVGGQDTAVYGMRHQLAVAVLNNTSIYLDRFAWVTAANVTVSGDVGAPVAISSTTAADPILVTTANVHGLVTGDCAEISGHAVNLVANGTWMVTGVSGLQFTISALGLAAGSATGTVVKQPPDADIQFTVNSAWNDIAGIGVTS